MATMAMLLTSDKERPDSIDHDAVRPAALDIEKPSELSASIRR